MLTYISPQEDISWPYQDFIAALKTAHFSGEIVTDMDSRVALATDNSLYEKTPQVILFPKINKDVEKAVKLSAEKRFSAIKISARGGGTSTCGQSLTDGVLIDFSKWMTNILEINIEKGYVRVQPGVVLDQLNRELAEHDRFFPIEISTSSRATLGGMFNTNASGKGSCLYGRFSTHILESRCVLSDGSVHHAKKVSLDTLEKLQSRNDKVGRIYTEIANIVRRQDVNTSAFSNLSRGMTGYDLKNILDQDKLSFNPNQLLAGAEGTLAMITELKLAISKRPKASALFALLYDDFLIALKHAKKLTTFSPSAIETIDQTILKLAQEDEIYPKVAPLFTEKLKQGQGLTLVEFVANNQASLNKKIAAFSDYLENTSQNQAGIIETLQTQKEDEMHILWELRKKGVGLLGALPGKKRPSPFVEDTAVPTEHLADYIKDLIAILDEMKLDYGIFGHVDAGCLHVRPALDMTDPNDRATVKIITDKVIKLLQQYQGILWAEHGKGYRSQYNETFVGSTMYHDFRRIKTVFDPQDKFNPGKVATSLLGNTSLVDVEQDFRGVKDQQIPAHIRAQSGPIMHCNGNGACFTVDVNEGICPSYKISKDRVHSPKGRAMLIREWLRRLGKRQIDLYTDTKRTWSLGALILRQLNSYRLKKGQTDLSNTVFSALNGCLGCKACASSCPLKVNIPNIKATFLAHYYTRYKRPIADFLIAHMESLSYWQSRFVGVSQKTVNSNISAWIAKKIGLVDLPRLSDHSITQALSAKALQCFNINDYNALSKEEQAKTVVLVQDAFTSFYDSQLVFSTYQLLEKMGFQVRILPFFKNGKPMHIKGFLSQFKRIAVQNNAKLLAISALNIPLIGIEPSMSLAYRDEYTDVLGKSQGFNVWLLQEWLTQQLKDKNYTLALSAKVKHSHPYHLLSHCSEKALHLSCENEWQTIFQAFGLTLKPIKVGCCGMAGSFGYEAQHQQNSQGIYELSWQQILSDKTIAHEQLLATGSSCREQVKRFAKVRLQHPIEILVDKYDF